MYNQLAFLSVHLQEPSLLVTLAAHARRGLIIDIHVGKTFILSTQSGVTPLCIAQQCGHSDVVSTAISYGADVIDPCHNGIGLIVHYSLTLQSYLATYIVYKVHMHEVGCFDLVRSKRHYTVREVEESELILCTHV